MLAVIDFTFVSAEADRLYGRSGHEGVVPIILTKLMFLLFFDDVPNERELMERLDYLRFPGYTLDAPPEHPTSLCSCSHDGGFLR